MIAAQVDDARPVFFGHLQDAADDGGVRRAPVVLALQRPEIDDVTVQDELVATDAAQDLEELAGLGVLGA